MENPYTIHCCSEGFTSNLSDRTILKFQIYFKNRIFAPTNLKFNIESVVQTLLQVSRLTVTQYLEKIVAAELLQKVKSDRNSYYLNIPLCELFLAVSEPLPMNSENSIESV